MAIPLDLWERMINGYPHCPAKELQNEIAGKPLTRENIKQVRLLVETLKNHEKQIRTLRQEIEHKIEAFTTES